MKFVSIFFFLALLGCSSKDRTKNKKPSTDSNSIHANQYTPLLGKWIKVLTTGERTIEIIDSTKVLVYNISNKNIISDTLIGTLVIMPHSYISIDFPTWRFYYRWKQDTLIQEDEMGEQERYVKRHF